MKTQRVGVILIGINGYGFRFLQETFRLETLGEVRLQAVIDPAAAQNPEWAYLQSTGVPAFDDLKDCLDSGIEADLVVIVSPIAFHASQTCAALAAGMDVLCEKPICATMAEARRMMAARDASGRYLEIGYQWSFSSPVQALKTDILAGRLGSLRSLRTCVAWPRGEVYFQRNNWAGRVRDPEGRPVFDSPVNNATAHFLHNMLFVAGISPTLSATPKIIEAECYRGNLIENFDTACCRLETVEGPEVLFFTTHCTKEKIGPQFSFSCDEAQIEYTAGGSIIARLSNGDQKDYGNPEGDPMEKFRYCLDRCRDPHKFPAVCGPEAAIAHTSCVQGFQATPVIALPASQLQYSNDKPETKLTFLPGLDAEILEGYRKGLLFSEMKLPWSSPATRVSLPVGPTETIGAREASGLS